MGKDKEKDKDRNHIEAAVMEPTMSLLSAAITASSPQAIDGVALLAPTTVVQPGWDVADRPDGLRVRIDFSAVATAAQRSAALAAVLAADLSESSRLSQKRALARQLAKALMDLSASDLSVLVRAVALAAGDGDNVLRRWITGFVSDVNASTTFAQLKTLILARGGLPQITGQAVKTAVKNRMDTPDADV